MAQPSLPDAIPKAILKLYIGSLIVQAFLTGLYTFILYCMVHGADSVVVEISALALNKLNNSKILQIGNNTGMATGFIADALLKNNWLLVSFGVLLLGESAAGKTLVNEASLYFQITNVVISFSVNLEEFIVVNQPNKVVDFE
ncbi:hypothetical protein BDQ17DRAFT_1337427 [Cyathus striatus]|nr:hypothetical protein BDQ17DRAFT_1337427 [Cyathus striatus]